MNKMAEEYSRMHVHPFKKVAERAFKDGYREALKSLRNLLELENTECFYVNDSNVRDDDY